MIAWLGVAAEKPSAEKPSVTRIEEVIDYFECTWLNDSFDSLCGKCSWKMDPGPTTTWTDGITKSRRSLGRSQLDIIEMI